MEGKYLDQSSVEQYRSEAEQRRQKMLEEQRDAAWHRFISWVGLFLIGGGLVAMIMKSLIDLNIGVVCLAVACAALGRGTK